MHTRRQTGAVSILTSADDDAYLIYKRFDFPLLAHTVPQSPIPWLSVPVTPLSIDQGSSLVFEIPTVCSAFFDCCIFVESIMEMFSSY